MDEMDCNCIRCRTGEHWAEILTSKDWTGALFVHGKDVTAELIDLVKEFVELKTRPTAPEPVLPGDCACACANWDWARISRATAQYIVTVLKKHHAMCDGFGNHKLGPTAPPVNDRSPADSLHGRCGQPWSRHTAHKFGGNVCPAADGTETGFTIDGQCKKCWYHESNHKDGQCPAPVLLSNDWSTAESADEDGFEKQAAMYAKCGKCGVCEYCLSVRAEIRAVRDEYRNRAPKPDPALSLSLLVVDFGSSCAVKAEVYNADYYLKFDQRDPDDDNEIISFYISKPFGDMVHRPFAEVKAAIDALADKPLPRIERSGDDVGNFILHWESEGHACWTVLRPYHLDALTEIFGKQGPVYEPGKWTRLEGEVSAWRYQN